MNFSEIFYKPDASAKDVVKPDVRTFVLGNARGHYVKEGLEG